MAGDWYLFDGIRAIGPLALDDVKWLLRDEQAAATRVWREGLDDWADPAALDEFAPAEPSPSSSGDPAPWTDPASAGETDGAALPAAAQGDPQTDRAGAARPYRFHNFIARNWRGGYSLPVAYWVFGFLGNVFAGLLALAVMAVLKPDSVYEPTAIFATILAIWTVVAAIAVWQSVGVWRSANRHATASARLGRASHWALLAKVAVFIGVMRLAASFLISGWPQLVETARMAFLDDPAIPAYSIRVMRDGTEAEITGGFKYGLTREFVRTLATSVQIKVVHLNSLGGRIGEAIKLNRVIRDSKLDTYVASNCLSACTIAFAAGARRVLRNGAVLGFHAASFPGMSGAELAESAQDQRDMFLAAGIDGKFIERALSTPNASIWKPTPAALLEAKVITAMSDGSDFSISGIGASPTPVELATLLANTIPLMRTIKTRFPADHDAIVRSLQDSFAGGRTEAEALAGTRAKLLVLLARLRPLADDAVLSDIGALYADEYNALGVRNLALCYRYASGIGAAVAPSEIPDELIARENDINRRVVETATSRPPVSPAISDALWKKVETALLKKGARKDQLDLLQAPLVPPERYKDYCTAVTMLFREVNRLPLNEAGIMMRDIMAEKASPWNR